VQAYDPSDGDLEKFRGCCETASNINSNDHADFNLPNPVPGFDKESRPNNVYVDYFIRLTNSGADDSAAVPIGAIVAIPGGGHAKRHMNLKFTWS
jgi:hypothetical protein